MAFPHSKQQDLLSRLHEAARSGHWEDALQLTAMLPEQKPPASRPELEEHLRLLTAALIAAKASRADAVVSLSRLNAAARFNLTPRDCTPERQDLADPADL